MTTALTKNFGIIAEKERGRLQLNDHVTEHMHTEGFWHALEILLKQHTICVDRPKGSLHPRYPDIVYPLDYGFLEGTRSGDGQGIDVWIGSLVQQTLSAVIVTTDLAKKEVEIKLLVGCTHEEMQTILRLHQSGMQAALLVERDTP